MNIYFAEIVIYTQHVYIPHCKVFSNMFIICMLCLFHGTVYMYDGIGEECFHDSLNCPFLFVAWIMFYSDWFYFQIMSCT